jgi:hypothetical protein
MEINDFIILNEDSHGLLKNSVGVIEEVINEDEFKIFFIAKRAELILSNIEITFLDIKETGKPFKYKVCNVCHILKEDYVDFEINQTDAQGRKTTRPSCRNCRLGIDGVKLLGAEKKKMMKIKPNKFFVCPICEKGSIPDITANLVIDHNHENGIAREWLCDSCNTGLGRFKDNVELLERAINYLKKYNQNY